MTEGLDGWMASPIGIINGHEFEQAHEDIEGLGSLVCCGPRGCKESDTTYQLNNNNSLPTKRVEGMENKESVSCLVVSDSMRPHGLLLTKLLCPWSSPGKNTGVGYHVLLQGIFPTQGLNLGSYIAGRFFTI